MTGQCLTPPNTVDVSNVFRIGSDGLVDPLPAVSQTLPQPFFPGALQTGSTAIPCPSGSTLCNPVGGDSRAVDADYRPESTDNIDFTIQRSFGRKMSIEVGYSGRRIRHEFAEVDLDAVPYMMTLGGQTFADAYKNLYLAICAPLGPTCATTASTFTYTGPPQPFFEAALTPGSGYCAGFANCSAAVASKQLGNFKATTVSDLWAGLNNGAGWTLGCTMLSRQATEIGLKTAQGYGNYNAAFFTLRLRDWHGVTALSNFTWGRALGTGALEQRSSVGNWLAVFNPSAIYGPSTFDYKLLYSLGVG